MQIHRKIKKYSFSLNYRKKSKFNLHTIFILGD